MQNNQYHISETELAGHVMFTITHLPTGNYTSVIAGYGGAINAFVVNGKHILLSATHAQAFESIIRKSFAGAQLFPFVNRINKATFSINEKLYALPVNDGAGLPHSLHGLVYNQPFTLAQINEALGKIVLQYHFKSNETSYPFSFLLDVTYCLNVDSLHIDTIIRNLSEVDAPMAYGWHPYIAIDGSMDECKLQLPATMYYETDDKLIPSGQVNYLDIFIEPATIGNLQLNQCFEMPAHIKQHTTVLESPDGTVIQLVQTGFAYTQYYLPPDRKSIAIEPQTAIPNALNNGIGLIKMKPGESMDFSFKIIVL